VHEAFPWFLVHRIGTRDHTIADQGMRALHGAEYGCASEFCKGGSMAARWREVSDEMMVGIGEWWLQHPKATLQEIEAVVDARLPESRVAREDQV
jgi:hypothetical protein